MTDFPDTRDSILLRIQSASDREAWEQFAAMYQPIIFRIAKARGLQDADAYDVGQRVMMSVAGSIARWHQLPSAKFRHWLLRVTRNAVINALSRKPIDQSTGSTSIFDLLNDVPQDDERSIDAYFELERRRHIFIQASEIVRSEVAVDSWRVFEITVLEQRSPEEAALETQKDIGAVYTAKCRVTDRLRRTVKKLEDIEK